MAEKYRLRREAKEELVSAAEWYENKQPGLGEEFYNEALEKIEKISNKPNSYSTFFKNFRKASLEKFPYWIVYIVQSPIVLVLSVWHKKRDPEALQKKLEKE
ncbi:MAG: type II toxin-antitoxin system RelE/ParE family toxin [Leptospiraceae bacterium]|nr:type II toxin-antitoxin system RelE/ParE family toxin [Leptospiraceae bacterium]MCP5501069.1 type II toxin-antitoxin system RelE/ParE family toxin [Leptospiraceae bacterium]